MSFADEVCLGMKIPQTWKRLSKSEVFPRTSAKRPLRYRTESRSEDGRVPAAARVQIAKRLRAPLFDVEAFQRGKLLTGFRSSRSNVLQWACAAERNLSAFVLGPERADRRGEGGGRGVSSAALQMQVAGTKRVCAEHRVSAAW